MTNREKGYRPSDVADLPRHCSPALGSRIGINAGGVLYRSDWIDNYPWGEKRWSSQPETLFRFDFNSNDREYWHRVKLFLVWLAQALPAGRRDWAHFAYKALRKLQHDNKRREWDQVLPEPIATWARAQLATAMQDLDCCDNDRVALKGNTGQVRRYMRQKSQGCCGFADFEAVGPDGKTYLIGFNYGH